MKLLEKLSKKLGFTTTETNIIIFIISACLIGLVVNIIKNYKNDQSYLEFDYKKEDSLFNASGIEDSVTDSNITQQEKKIDSNRELLDFTKEKFTKKNAEITFSAVPIKINKASISDLRTLPGIGEKTANSIIEYRNLHGSIKSINELLNIKGIGKAKLNKIKSLISLE